MTLVQAIHHLRFACKDLWKSYRIFTCAFGYKFHCLSRHEDCLSLVIKNGPTLIALSDSGSVSHLSGINRRYPQTDGPFDIAFEVNDVHQICDRVRRINGSSYILAEPEVHADQNGCVTMAVIRSCVGEVVHTLLDSSNYRGLFLPGYVSLESISLADVAERLQQSATLRASVDVVCLDHVSFACRHADTDRVLHWYSQVFEMKRVTCSESENEIDGVLIEHDGMGMRLITLDTGAGHVKNTSVASFDTCKLVLTEPLTEADDDQLTRFLKVNKGPGIQHIALRVCEIMAAAQSARNRGAQFIDTPKEYYDELSNSSAFKEISVDLNELRESGVLLDTEVLCSNENSSKRLGFLLQIITKPLFEPDGFFLELIDRQGSASGLGVMNINSLWRAVEATSGAAP
ncbi:unnamed protein product [Dicrocoelium dendriticum]|nr:unnamed protein product [Dicrocoelium dendriticum]